MVEDNIEITDNDFIVDFQIEANCYRNNTFVGATACKKITVNLLADSSINLEGKTIKVYTGISNKGEIEYIPLGTFIIDKPTTEEVTQKTSFTGYDYLIKFNTTFENKYSYPISLFDLLSNICGEVGVELANENIVNGDYQVIGNPFSGGDTNKIVLEQICQLSGGIAKINSKNQLEIINLSQNENVEVLDGEIYTSLSKNLKYGKINSVTLNLSSIEGESTTLKDETSISQNGLTDITISDNYFLINANERQKAISQLFDVLNGLEYTPFDMENYGFPYLEIGDKIEVVDTNGESFYTYIFDMSFKYDGSYNGHIKLEQETETQKVYNQIGTTKQHLKRVERLVDKINGEIIDVIEAQDEQNKKMSKVVQTVSEINSKISDIADITTSQETVTGKLVFEKINQSEPIHIEIKPLSENISYLYPFEKLFPAEDLFIKLRTLRFTNTQTNEVFDYELPEDLLYYDSENYDEFILDYDSQTCYVNKKCAYNDDGNVILLNNEIVNQYDFPHIQLTDGDYIVEILKYDEISYKAYLFVRLMSQNMYATQFPTKSEMNSEINQTVDKINISVDKKLNDYVTNTEMHSAININTNEITSIVAGTYETKENATSYYSTLIQTANSLQSQVNDNDKNISTLEQTANSLQSQINSNDTDISTIKQTVNEVNIEVGKKYNTSDFTNAKITAKINDGTSSVKISANKINLSATDILNLLAGNTINLTSKNIIMSADCLSIDKYGRIKLTDSSDVDSSLEITSSDNYKYKSKIRSSGATFEGPSGFIRLDADFAYAGGFLKIAPSDYSSDYTTIQNGAVSAMTVTQRSKESIKKNIEKYDENALDIVKNSEIYTYNFKTENDNNKKHIGFVIADDGGSYKTPEQVISEDKTGISNYDMTSILWKAVQELQSEVEDLKQRLEEK